MERARAGARPVKIRAGSCPCRALRSVARAGTLGPARLATYGPRCSFFCFFENFHGAPIFRRRGLRWHGPKHTKYSVFFLGPKYFLFGLAVLSNLPWAGCAVVPETVLRFMQFIY